MFPSPPQISLVHTPGNRLPESKRSRRRRWKKRNGRMKKRQREGRMESITGKSENVDKVHCSTCNLYRARSTIMEGRFLADILNSYRSTFAARRDLFALKYIRTPFWMLNGVNDEYELTGNRRHDELAERPGIVPHFSSAPTQTLGQSMLMVRWISCML